jgi:hypothetical protein
MGVNMVTAGAAPPLAGHRASRPTCYFWLALNRLFRASQSILQFNGYPDCFADFVLYFVNDEGQTEG